MLKRLSGWLGARLRIGLSKRDVAIVLHGAGWRAKSTLLAHQALADHAMGDQTALQAQALAAQCAALLADTDCANLPLCVTVADAWTRLFMVEPPRNATRLQDLQAAAAMRFQALYGEAPADWQLQADWQLGAPFLVCAMPLALRDTLQRIAADNKLHLISLLPHFVVAWNRHCRALAPGAWFGTVQDDSLMLGAIAHASKRRLQTLRSIAIPPGDIEPRWLQDQVARTALQAGLATPSLLQLAGNRQQFRHASAAAGIGALVVRSLDKTLADEKNESASPPSAAIMLAQARWQS
jgi:hypothetical protein